MKLQKKHFVIIFVVAVLILLGYYIFRSLQTPPLPPEEAVTRLIPPLLGEDRENAIKVMSKDPPPLSKEDKESIQQVVSLDPKPLRGPEKAMVQKMMGI